MRKNVVNKCCTVLKHVPYSLPFIRFRQWHPDFALFGAAAFLLFGTEEYRLRNGGVRILRFRPQDPQPISVRKFSVTDSHGGYHAKFLEANHHSTRGQVPVRHSEVSAILIESRHSWSLQGIVLDIAATRRLTLNYPNRMPNRKLSQLEMAENGGPSEWRPFGMAARRNGGPTTPVSSRFNWLRPTPNESFS